MNLDELAKIREEKERRMLAVSSAREEWELDSTQRTMKK